MVVADLKPVEAGTTVVTLSQSGGTSQKFSRDPSFSLDKDSSWITIKTSSPSDFTISASSNSTGKGRIGYVYVKRQGVTVNTYKIIQPGTTSLSVGPAKGSTSTYSKNSNQSVTTSYSWITLYKPNDYNVRMDYAANTTGSTRTGYVYVKEGSTIITTYKITQSATVSVTYNKNGGSGSNFSRTLTVGSAYGKVDNPTRTGYNFTGWYTAASGGSQVTETTKVTNTSNHTLYAHWSAKSYTVSFNGNGGSSVSAKTVYYDGTYGSLTNSSRTGYTFAGWFTAASGGTQVTSSTKVTITANQTLYAHWTPNNYTVSFNSQGGSSVSSKTVTFNSTYGTLSNPTKTGYTFAGWYTAASGGTKITSSSTVTTAGNHTLYAHWTANTYTITYDKNGGAGENFTRSITYGSNYGKVDNPTRTGYTFAGYYTAKSGGTQVTETTKMLTAGSHTLYAHWTAKTYTVSFNSQGGSSVASKTVTYGCFYETLASPTKEGYTFAGWYTAASGGNKVTASTTVTTASNHTLYAHWTGKTYTVSFDSQGGSSVSSKTVTYGSTYGTLTSPTKTGYTFAGWYTAASGGSQKTASSTVSTAGNHTLYAHWTANNFTITYDKNDGSGSTFTKSVAYGSTYGKVDTPSRTGYTFIGYYTAKSGGSQVTETTKMLTASNHTLYGRWTPKTFTVSFDSQGGSSVASKTVTYDGTYGTLTNPTKEGYTFNGWYTAASGGTKITASTKVTLTANQTLYAHYTQIVVTVTYDKNGGSGDNYTRKIAYGSAYGKVDNPTKTGYDFRGWYTSTAYETQVTETTLMKKTVNHTLYAKWTPKTFTITFDSQGGSSVASKTVTYASAYGSLPSPTKIGYTFTGWYTAVSGGSQKTASTAVTTTGDHTLYAHWTADIFTLSFNSNGGSTVSSTSITYGNKYGTLPSPTKTGYTFVGWYTAASGGSKVSSSTLATTASNHTLYARWTADKYTVNFDSQGGSYVSPETVTYGSTYGSLPSPTKKGFTFDGWYTAASGGSLITSNTTVARAGDHTLYAHWTGITVKLKFNSKGGSNVSDTTVTYGKEYGTLPIPTREGYTFDGWARSSINGTLVTASTIVEADFDHNLYAYWTVKSLSISFDSQGGSQVDCITATYGKIYGELPTPTRKDYIFDGWYMEKNGGCQITPYTIVRAESDQTLYAHWTKKTKITIKINTDPSYEDERTIGEAFETLPPIPGPPPSGFIFDGWFTEKEGGKRITSDTIVTPSIQTLYAHWKPANGVKDDWEPKPIKVLVIKFDPMITIKNGEQVYLHELMEHLDVKKSTIRKWYDPDTLAEEFVNEMKEVSHGNVNYEIVDSIPLDEFPSSTQMRPDPRPYTTPWEWTAPLMQYSPLEYYNTLITACNSTEGNYWDYSGWINTGKTFDYDKYLEKLNVYNRVNDGEIDEVWIFTGPCCGTGLSESMMIGEDPFYINGPPMVKEGVRNFVVFGFCFETGLGNMLEDAGHRMEWTMSRVYSGVSGEAQREVGFDITKENYKKGTDKDGNIIYKQYSELNAWEKFWAHDLETGGSIIAGVGSVHCGPNARKQYDWNNCGVDIDKMERDTPVQVQSYCDNWLDYPYLSETSRYVGSDEWGGDQIGHHRWWLEHIPHAKGTTYGKYNNWWKYYLLEDMK
jgi:uncharacterized repeat protein (TIGR02543 family)